MLQLDLLKDHGTKDRNAFQHSIQDMKDLLQGEMNTETEALKTYVLQITNKASAHRETL